MANSAFDHSPTIVVPGSSTNTALVRWSGTGADTFLDSTILVGATTMGLAADTDLLTFGNGTLAITGAVTGVTALTASGAVTGGTLAGTVSTATQGSITSAANLATVGTITTGVWNGTAIVQAYIGAEAINESKMQISNGPTNGQVLTARSGNTGGMTWEAAAGGGDLSFGGDTFGADKVIGSNDAYDLGFETTGATRMTIDSGGNVGIGTTSPDSTLQVVGTATIGSDAVVSPQRRLTVYGTGAGYGPLLVSDSGHSMIDLVSRAGSGHSYAIASRNDGTFQISDDTAGGARFHITAAGEITMPSQPCVLAFNSASDANQTGTGTQATVDFDTEVYDQNADFASDTFTAPVTGRYLLIGNIDMEGITAAGDSINCNFSGANRQFTQTYNTTNNLPNAYSAQLFIIMDMDANDTVICRAAVSGESSDVVDVSGSAAANTSFSICLLA